MVPTSWDPLSKGGVLGGAGTPEGKQGQEEKWVEEEQEDPGAP